jgi:hypothetical protein
VAQSTIYNISVAGTKSCKNELPQILALAHLGIVFHPHMEGVQLVPGDMSKELGKVQPPQELYRGVKVTSPVNR